MKLNKKIISTAMAAMLTFSTATGVLAEQDTSVTSSNTANKVETVNTSNSPLTTIDELLKGYENKFTLMDKYITYSKEFSKSNMSIEGTMNFDMSVISEGKTVPVKGSAAISGLTDSTKADMTINFDLDFEDLMTYFNSMIEAQTSSSNSSETEIEKNLQKKTFETMMSSFKNFSIDYKMNLSEGKIYMKSPIFDTILDSKDAWFLMDLNSLFAKSGVSFDFASLLNSLNKGSFYEYLKESFKSLPLTTEAEVSQAKKTIETMVSLLSDDSFIKEGNYLVSSFNETQDNAAVSFKMILKTSDGEAVTGYGMEIKTSLDGVEFMNMNIDVSGTKETAAFKFNIPDLLNMNFDMNINFAETTNLPEGKPAEGSNIIPIPFM